MSKTPNVIATAPPRIFLVIGEDCPQSEDFKNLFEVSWCASDIDGNGIEYLRVDQPITDSEALRLADAIELRVENRAERMVIADKLRNIARRKTPPLKAPNPDKPTTWRERFTEAVAHLCGAEPPEEYVSEWLDNIDVNGEHRLQSWVGAQRIPSWAQCIVILDAARVLADTPEEGIGHLDEDGN